MESLLYYYFEVLNIVWYSVVIPAVHIETEEVQENMMSLNSYVKKKKV